MFISSIVDYFHLGLKVREMKHILLLRHGIHRSERQILRILHAHGLFRHKHQSDIIEVACFIESQLNATGQMLGYRMMHCRCIENGLKVPRDTVYSIMQMLDPSGLQARLRRRLKRRQYFSSGPNHCWHLDGYDKLKPYGICIHGCIDGFSRDIIWMRAYRTNNNPKVVAGYYIEAVMKRCGCPKIVRSDHGTENGHVAMMQRLLRMHHTDDFSGDRSFLYGSSTSNQRIEFFWGIVRRQCTQFWMNIFSHLSHEGTFCGDDLDKGLIQFCFCILIQRDLDRLVDEWSTHRIRTSHNTIVPAGRPLMLHFFPELYGASDQLCSASFADIAALSDECTFIENTYCDDDLAELCNIIMHEKTLQMPSCAEDAVILYLELRHNLHPLF